MKLTAENYFSKEANMEYMSVSIYKNFVGTDGQLGCEARAMALLKGEWSMEMTTALLVGSYVDSHYEGTLDVFLAQHPEVCKKDGTLKAEYMQANDIISRIDRDPLFTFCLSGEKQVIMTAEVMGAKWKIKIDSLLIDRPYYNPETKETMLVSSLVDLKVMKSIREAFWVKDVGYESMPEYWGYTIQAAIYQQVYESNTGVHLPFLLAVASKEKTTDIEIIGFDEPYLKATKDLMFPNIGRILDLKAGRVEPDRCGVCDWCRSTKVLKTPVHFSTLINKIR